MNKSFEKLKEYTDKAAAYQAALALMQWDNDTLAPKDATDNTAKLIGILSGESYNTIVNDEVRALLHTLSAEQEQKSLSEIERAIVKNLLDMYEQIEPIPFEEYCAYNELLAKASSVWANAKRTNDYASFSPTLAKILSYQKKFASYRRKGTEELYDILLNDFEKGFTQERLDVFFSRIKEVLIPLVEQVAKKRTFISNDFLHQNFDIEKQKKLSKAIASYMGFDFNRGVMAESEHPFTTSFHNHDVRITTHYYENSLESALFSTIHEGGHALYEFGVDDAVTMTPASALSMGIHESQSRFYENIIGRSKDFWVPLYDKLVALFPEQLSAVSLDDFYRAINKSEPSLIRTEADELTYPLHILIRYEIEKMLFHDEITVEELPDVWNQKYKEYLGVMPTDLASGVLQDVHWSLGSFAYFPSYAIGSAIAAQLYYYMKDTMPLETYLREGNLAPVTEFLRTHIHRFGSVKSTMELVEEATKAPFDVEYYLRYLTEKYSTLYELQ